MPSKHVVHCGVKDISLVTIAIIPILSFCSLNLNLFAKQSQRQNPFFHVFCDRRAILLNFKKKEKTFENETRWKLLQKGFSVLEFEKNLETALNFNQHFIVLTIGANKRSVYKITFSLQLMLLLNLRWNVTLITNVVMAFVYCII
jgi:hypothetical protein